MGRPGPGLPATLCQSEREQQRDIPHLEHGQRDLFKRIHESSERQRQCNQQLWLCGVRYHSAAMDDSEHDPVDGERGHIHDERAPRQRLGTSRPGGEQSQRHCAQYIYPK